ncbi:hypothetical protein O4273_24040 [Rhodococcus ruber]|uniref:hypothetical protein n=1 Tax=Rhodococcus ruber TaxID=1830 RepID=UPI0022B315EA|nr:hypothetical protein [Rhodococcus ruber]MCZ4505905.1 hypothetical protein [Rhodococcus ruber]
MATKHISGNRREYVLNRLERDNPDLFARVQAGELSAHRAAVEAGWRSQTVALNLTNPEQIEQVLRRHVQPEVLAELADRLTA